MRNKIITIGILAHVDAGKTSLTESLLYESGSISSIGSVDKGSTITDGMAMEKSRGISIKTSTVNFTWKDTQINIVDTPGHIDFSAEVDRALSVLDLVILVISAVEGVQAHTLNLWESIKERNLPVIIFINKIDRTGADPERVFKEIEKDLSTNLFTLNYPDLIDIETPKIVPFSKANPHLTSFIVDHSMENLAEINEDFLEEYLEGLIQDLSLVLDRANKAIENQSLIPTIFGSAKMQLSIDTLLDEIIIRKPMSPKINEGLHARIFKVEYDQKLGRLAYIRVFNGNITAKDVVSASDHAENVKINQIFQRKLGKLVQVSELSTGEIGIVATSEIVVAGETLGTKTDDKKYDNMIESVLSVQAVAKEDKDYQKLGEALEIFNIEDPQLDFKWYKEDREYQLNILGPIQTEVLKDSLSNRFNIEADFLPPKVIYLETPKSSAQGYIRYWMPKPCWAIMTFIIEPGPLGSGVEFESKVRTSDISTKFQNEVKCAIPWSLRQGIKGWEVTDIKIILLEGSEHNVHSNPGDFLLATPMGVLRGIEAADTDLLEPMYAFSIKAHLDHLGTISSDLTQMKATLESPNIDGEFFLLKGRVPVALSLDYGIKFNTTTSGKGRLKLTLDGYQKTSISDEKIRPFRGVSPLDESLWILHNRGAFKAEDRK